MDSIKGKEQNSIKDFIIYHSKSKDILKKGRILENILQILAPLVYNG